MGLLWNNFLALLAMVFFIPTSFSVGNARSVSNRLESLDLSNITKLNWPANLGMKTYPMPSLNGTSLVGEEKGQLFSVWSSRVPLGRKVSLEDVKKEWGQALKAAGNPVDRGCQKIKDEVFHCSFEKSETNQKPSFIYQHMYWIHRADLVMVLVKTPVSGEHVRTIASYMKVEML
jgi:hypothetical protein